MGCVLLVVPLGASEVYFFGVDYDYVVAAVYVWRKARLVLAPYYGSYLAG